MWPRNGSDGSRGCGSAKTGESWTGLRRPRTPQQLTVAGQSKASPRLPQARWASATAYWALSRSGSNATVASAASTVSAGLSDLTHRDKEPTHRLHAVKQPFPLVHNPVVIAARQKVEDRGLPSRVDADRWGAVDPASSAAPIPIRAVHPQPSLVSAQAYRPGRRIDRLQRDGVAKGPIRGSPQRVDPRRLATTTRQLNRRSSLP